MAEGITTRQMEISGQQGGRVLGNLLSICPRKRRGFSSRLMLPTARIPGWMGRHGKEGWIQRRRISLLAYRKADQGNHKRERAKALHSGTDACMVQQTPHGQCGIQDVGQRHCPTLRSVRTGRCGRSNAGKAMRKRIEKRKRLRFSAWRIEDG